MAKKIVGLFSIVRVRNVIAPLYFTPLQLNEENSRLDWFLIFQISDVEWWNFEVLLYDKQPWK